MNKQMYYTSASAVAKTMLITVLPLQTSTQMSTKQWTLKDHQLHIKSSNLDSEPISIPSLSNHLLPDELVGPNPHSPHINFNIKKSKSHHIVSTLTPFHLTYLLTILTSSLHLCLFPTPTPCPLHPNNQMPHTLRTSMRPYVLNPKTKNKARLIPLHN